MQLAASQILTQLAACEILTQLAACKILTQLAACKILMQLAACKILTQLAACKILTQLAACQILTQLAACKILTQLAACKILTQLAACKILRQLAACYETTRVWWPYTIPTSNSVRNVKNFYGKLKWGRIHNIVAVLKRNLQRSKSILYYAQIHCDEARLYPEFCGHMPILPPIQSLNVKKFYSKLS